MTVKDMSIAMERVPCKYVFMDSYSKYITSG